ncbi:Rab3 GTPase-activating protein catalytic subunit [Eumeta japonica]|uniref:Rab3 GTPase-activating protein catalytic subunit n=1 Tax=Eumeta variegata TaxID=151549 RepID=A0A4C1SXL8_EUMVA|nr:Rab3 GTPase-activating protein catalytic subunit [Eumeta japonica]
MNEEIDEYDIYHQDFTTASEWEVFIARIEEIVNDWHLSKSKLSKRPTGYTKKWIEKSEEINFYGLSFTLSYHTLEVQNNSFELEDDRQKEDFENKSFSTQLLNNIWEASKSFMDVEDGGTYPVSSWYGLTQYIMLNPKKSLTEESQIKMTVENLLDLLDNNKFLMDTLGLSRSLGLVNPLYKITEAPITISKLVKAAIGAPDISNFKGPIADELLMPLLYYIFPDAVDDSSYPYNEHFEIEYKQGENTEPKLCGYVKTSPEGSLVRRLSVVAARLYDEGGLPYLAHFWYEFTQELQYRWEHHILIPG